MADDVKDIAIYTGSEWTSLSELAAGSVDATLPISSDDGTVVLDSPSANTFTVSTGGVEALKVAEKLITSRVDQVQQINKNATSAPSNAGNVNNKQMMTLKSTDEAGAKFVGLTFQHVLSSGKGASACIGLQDESADGVPNKGEMQFVIRSDSSAQVVTPLKINKDAIIVDGQVRTPTVKGPADTDAQIDLGTNFSVSTGGEERLRVNQLGCLGVKTTDTAFSSTYGIVDARANDSQTLSDQIDSSSSILATNSTTYSLRNVAVGDGTYAGFASRVTNSLGTHQTAGFACEAVGSGFSPNMVWVSRSSSTASKKQMVLDSSGNLRIENGHLQTTTVKGPADTDAQIDLGGNLTVSTGGETRATIGAPNQLIKLADCTGYTGATQYGLIVNPSVPATCSKFISFRSSPNITDKTATLLHVVSYQRDDVDEQCGFFYGPSTTAYAKIGKVGFRSNQPGIDYAFLADQPGVPSRFAGGVQTPTVKGVVSTDAQIDLGSELRTTNHTPTQPNSIATKQTVDDKIWVGTTAQYNAIATKNPTTLYCLTD